MKLLYDKHSSESIFCHAFSKSEIGDKLEETTRQLVRHLIKLRLFPFSPEVFHWKQEVYTFLHNVSRIKRSNKFPTSSFILSKTIELNIDMIEVWKDNILKDYQDMRKVDVTDADLVDSILSYYKWLADNLSKYGEVSRTDTYNALYKLNFGVVLDEEDKDVEK